MAVNSPFVRVLEGFLGRHEMEGHYQALKPRYRSKMFFREAFKLTNITLDGDTSPLSTSKDRPVLFIANHPFGVIDGLIMCNMALDYANDFQSLSTRCSVRTAIWSRTSYRSIFGNQRGSKAERALKQLAGKPSRMGYH